MIDRCVLCGFESDDLFEGVCTECRHESDATPSDNEVAPTDPDEETPW